MSDSDPEEDLANVRSYVREGLEYTGGLTPDARVPNLNALIRFVRSEIPRLSRAHDEARAGCDALEDDIRYCLLDPDQTEQRANVLNERPGRAPMDERFRRFFAQAETVSRAAGGWLVALNTTYSFVPKPSPGSNVDVREKLLPFLPQLEALQERADELYFRFEKMQERNPELVSVF